MINSFINAFCKCSCWKLLWFSLFCSLPFVFYSKLKLTWTHFLERGENEKQHSSPFVPSKKLRSKMRKSMTIPFSCANKELEVWDCHLILTNKKLISKEIDWKGQNNLSEGTSWSVKLHLLAYLTIKKGTITSLVTIKLE